jgi:uncharacterized protein YbaP (TraB family)
MKNSPKNTESVADRVALISIKLIVAANILFLISFLVVTFVATSRAQAQAPVCTGKNLMEVIHSEDPKMFERIEKEAAAVKNGEGVLWKIEKEGAEPSYLFGTMHLTDPRVVTLTTAAQKAFDASDTVVIETTDVLDQAKMMASIMQQPDLMMFTDDTTLLSLFSPEDAQTVSKALDARGIPPGSVKKMKPWMLSAMLSLPACETARKEQGAPILDIKLANDAQAQGKSVEGLETAVDQLKAMASLSMDFHVKGLLATLELGNRMDDVIETMLVLYQKEQTGMFWPFMNALTPPDELAEVGYTDFEEAMVTSRNKTMATNASPLIDEGAAFIAVGALHLPGDEGLIELLRARNYAVSRID